MTYLPTLSLRRHFANRLGSCIDGTHGVNTTAMAVSLFRGGYSSAGNAVEIGEDLESGGGQPEIWPQLDKRSGRYRLRNAVPR